MVDLVILDLEMPEMDGIATLKEIKARQFPCRVVVFTSTSKKGAHKAMEALNLGASEFIPKPTELKAGEAPHETIKQLLAPILRGFFQLEVPTNPVVAPAAEVPRVVPRLNWESFKPEILVIGSSTGGPAVLESMFAKLSAPLDVPVFIAQHMPPVFTATLAERLQKLCGITCKEGSDQELVRKNCVYIAPGDFHMRLVKDHGVVRIALDKSEPIHFVRPAVDPLFETAAAIYQNRTLGVILTGMGQDGKIGAEVIKASGGGVIIQNEKTCTVFGMPGAVFRAGAFDRQGSPNEIVQMINLKVASKRPLASGF